VMLMAPEWSASYAVVIFLMWAIMMIAMMLPSAAPAILLAAALMRQRGGNRIFGPTGLFVVGYLEAVFTIPSPALPQPGICIRPEAASG
jgi:predicted metal-binding membrane protein